MSNSTAWQHILELAQNIPSAGVTPNYDDGTRELDEQVTAYFRERLVQTGGQITPDVLREADQLYDLRGISTVLAEALQLQVYDLQYALGQTQSLKCETCGASFQVHALRRKSGYWLQTLDQKTLCPKCRRAEADDRREDVQSQREVYRTAYLYRRRVDSALGQARDVLAVKDFCDHLLVLRQYWTKGHRAWNYETQQSYSIQGCMICGEPSPLNVILGQDTIPQDNYFRAIVNGVANGFWGFEFANPGNSDLEDLPPLDPPTKVAQVLWRYAPDGFFHHHLRWPVFAMPLVLLCERCTAIVPATHIRTKI